MYPKEDLQWADNHIKLPNVICLAVDRYGHALSIIRGLHKFPGERSSSGDVLPLSYKICNRPHHIVILSLDQPDVPVPGPPSKSERIDHLDISHPPYANDYSLSTEEIITVVERLMRGSAVDIAVGGQTASTETEHESQGCNQIEEEEEQNPEERGQGLSKLEVLKRLFKDGVGCCWILHHYVLLVFPSL
ncbi:uncharacterized protein BO95DRAFT_90793 [Aspergillus brunneoviolaceus CBS 621.78]|uniref:Uncharacterized protein n=1 Tax=Aspergillus brunneoviolaceus CBS 621.78 TaxID=1450534 RepID=A0ACD1GDA5_9EURO|nr:hypothetical protein BO95DRAFT_90793 [Aspergillus brunneoviolaceus CBS 621.78]RAH47104.1 hypothetical protein BO95DRAFT_90793 [Aspergillus brunneoviolaceus CBS 621.78]